MNNKAKNIIIWVIVVIVVALAIWLVSRGETPVNTPTVNGPTNTPETVQIPVSETTKVSGSLSKYQNAELGFSVQYPTSWQKGETPYGVQFIVPIDSTQVSTVNRLEVDVSVNSSKCNFPPVTTVEKRGTLDVGGFIMNTISMSNTVQGRSYYNKMYSLEKGGICYFFTFSYVALSPDSKGLSGSNLTQAQNNNKAIKSTVDDAFTAMVKSLTFIVSPTGQEETSASPIKK